VYGTTKRGNQHHGRQKHDQTMWLHVRRPPLMHQSNRREVLTRGFYFLNHTTESAQIDPVLGLRRILFYNGSNRGWATDGFCFFWTWAGNNRSRTAPETIDRAQRRKQSI
jgi:hypothetical protein